MSWAGWRRHPWSISFGESGFTEDESSFERAERLMELRRQAQGFLSVAGFIIGSATLSFGVLRNALMAVEPYREDFPPILVIVWGGFNSVFLALAYAPMVFALLVSFCPASAHHGKALQVEDARRRASHRGLELHGAVLHEDLAPAAGAPRPSGST